MNRNQESHFATVPTVNHPRSSFDRSFSHKTTFNVGDVVPIFCEEVLPGDTFEIATSKVVRMQTLLAPVLDNIYLDTYFFFVPNRIVWSHWKDFMGENNQSAWTTPVSYQMPCLYGPSSSFKVGNITDYLGIPPGSSFSSGDRNMPIHLPFRGYALICNDFFRDQNLTDPLYIPLGEGSISAAETGNYITDVVRGGAPFKASKYHDYFTSALPAPQKGPDVNVLATSNINLPVVTGPVHSAYTYTFEGVSKALPMTFALGNNSVATPTYSGYNYVIPGTSPNLSYKADDSILPGIVPPVGNDTVAIPSNLWARTGVQGASTQLSLSVNALRLSTVTQMYYEALARAGSRYDEQILQFFGVKSPDGRLQQPEYLGGNRIHLNVHEVTNTAQSEQDFLGDLGAMSVTADSHADFVRSFTEHGFVFGLVVARYDHSYTQGIPAKFLRKDKFDFYNPLFARIGEQPIRNVEIYAQGNSNNDTVFGYQEAWASYRYALNTASGYLRPSADNSLSHWTLADNYASLPTLSHEWIQEDKTNVDRALAVTSSLSHQIFGDFYFNFKCVRCMPMYSVPGAIGAF